MTEKNTLGKQMVNIYREHNGLAVEEKLKCSGLNVDYIDIQDQYVFANEKDFILFDLNGNLIESSVEVPEHILNEMSVRTSKTQNMISSIW